MVGERRFISLSDNIQETFGLTIIEGMAAGKPVIATDWDGYRQTVRHGDTGFLIPTYMPQLTEAGGENTHGAMRRRRSLTTPTFPQRASMCRWISGRCGAPSSISCRAGICAA